MQPAKMDDLPLPAVGGSSIIGAAGMELSWTKWADVSTAVAERQEQVPRGSKIPWELQSNRVRSWTIYVTSNVDLKL